MDRHRIGTFDANSGRFTVLLDLNDGTNITFVRDSFQVTPSQKQTIQPGSTRRYGGSRSAGEIHDNGTISGTWLCAGSTSDLAFAQLKNVLALHESTRGDLYYEWRATGASRSTYYELRGGLPWAFDYSAVQFLGLQATKVSGGWQIAPTAAGDPMDIFDDFSVDTIATEWTQDSGAASVVSGQVQWASTGVKKLRHTARGYRPTDVTVTVKITTGTSVAAIQAGVTVRELDASNYLLAQIEAANLRIYKADGGVFTQLATTAFTPSTSTAYWVRLRAEGNVLSAAVYTSAPTPLGTSAAFIATTLTGGDATKFGAGIGGDVGFRAGEIAHTGFRFDDFTSRPYSYVKPGSQTTAAHVLDLYGIPGTAPAKVDAYTTTPSGVQIRSAIIGWAPKPPAGAGITQLGVAEFTGTGDATCSGGSYSATGPNWAFTLVPNLATADDFSDTMTIEVWVVIRANATGTATVVASAFPFSPLDYAASRFTPEYGLTGITCKTVNGRTITRAGTLPLPINGSSSWSVNLNVTGTPVLGVDCAIVVPARQRACTATGQLDADAQTWMTAAPGYEATKVIRSSLAGAMIQEPSSGPAYYAATAGVSGQLLEFPPGDVQVLHRAGLTPVDAPDLASTDILSSSTMATHYAIQPRFHLLRDT